MQSTINRRIMTATLAGAFLCGPNALVQAQGQYDRGRNLVARTLSDLRRASRLEQGSRERERYANAERHLSQFDRELSRNRFDKDKLDSAIDDVNNVVERNTLDPRSRDNLRQDLSDLRRLRETRGASY